eukprot:gnl/TRDRNA2_/TRDRNA2_84730_c0_seq1.p1 gnl/TRDRNA2_/TRDRNA2_84730_c0~~gnl/TRDRNA2_/TRDRNA2_84730_c0_seq1.p1  ORF type:complete len:168 (-),score=19.12 gnl/TRDRNA2_/TRDRNA2_84730_c0_seq1:89-592(-)
MLASATVQSCTSASRFPLRCMGSSGTRCADRHCCAAAIDDDDSEEQAWRILADTPISYRVGASREPEMPFAARNAGVAAARRPNSLEHSVQQWGAYAADQHGENGVPCEPSLSRPRKRANSKEHTDGISRREFFSKSPPARGKPACQGAHALNTSPQIGAAAVSPLW